MRTFTIGQLARQTGVGIETIRYYERKGLLDEPQRRASGYRQYDDTVVARLRFIRRSKNLALPSPRSTNCSACGSTQIPMVTTFGGRLGGRWKKSKRRSARSRA